MRDRMDIAFSDYFVLQVSRKDALKETLDHLWGNEKRLLRKPLKIRLGDDFGEIGIDQGGVTYEFFQIVLSQAFQPDTGEYHTTYSPSVSNAIQGCLLWIHRPE